VEKEVNHAASTVYSFEFSIIILKITFFYQPCIRIEQKKLKTHAKTNTAATQHS
jgi:hypothetical protein